MLRPGWAQLAIVIVLLLMAVTVAERVLQRDLSLNRPAHTSLTLLTLESPVLWLLATLLHVVLWWLMRVTSITSIVICVLQ